MNITDKYTQFIKWPTEENPVKPSMADGSELPKPTNISMKEYEWNTIDIHTKKIGVPKAVWIKYAIFKLLEQEQHYYSKTTPK